MTRLLTTVGALLMLGLSLDIGAALAPGKTTVLITGASCRRLRRNIPASSSSSST